MWIKLLFSALILDFAIGRRNGIKTPPSRHLFCDNGVSCIITTTIRSGCKAYHFNKGNCSQCQLQNCEFTILDTITDCFEYQCTRSYPPHYVIDRTNWTFSALAIFCLLCGVIYGATKMIKKFRQIRHGRHQQRLIGNESNGGNDVGLNSENDFTITSGFESSSTSMSDNDVNDTAEVGGARAKAILKRNKLNKPKK